MPQLSPAIRGSRARQGRACLGQRHSVLGLRYLRRTQPGRRGHLGYVRVWAGGVRTPRRRGTRPPLQAAYHDDAMKFANATMETMWAFMPDWDTRQAGEPRGGHLRKPTPDPDRQPVPRGPRSRNTSTSASSTPSPSIEDLFSSASMMPRASARGSETTPANHWRTT